MVKISKMKKILQNFLYPILSIPIITSIILLPFNLDEISELLTMVIPLMWLILTIIYLIAYSIFSFFVSSTLPKIILSLGCSYLVLGQLFRIMHWPGAKVSNYTGLALILLALILLIVRLKPKKLK